MSEIKEVKVQTLTKKTPVDVMLRLVNESSRFYGSLLSLKLPVAMAFALEDSIDILSAENMKIIKRHQSIMEDTSLTDEQKNKEVLDMFNTVRTLELTQISKKKFRDIALNDENNTIEPIALVACSFLFFDEDKVIPVDGEAANVE